jgi:hypothetical protein
MDAYKNSTQTVNLEVYELAIRQDFDIPVATRTLMVEEMTKLVAEGKPRDRIRATQVLLGLARHNQIDRPAARHVPAAGPMGEVVDPATILEAMIKTLPISPPAPPYDSANGQGALSAPKDASVGSGTGAEYTSGHFAQKGEDHNQEGGACSALV